MQSKPVEAALSSHCNPSQQQGLEESFYSVGVFQAFCKHCLGMGTCQDKAIPICWGGDCPHCIPQTGQAHLAPEQLVGLNKAQMPKNSDFGGFLRLSLDAAKEVSCSCTTPSDYSMIQAVRGFTPAVASSLQSVWEQQLASLFPMQNVMLHVDTADNIAQVKS